MKRMRLTRRAFFKKASQASLAAMALPAIVPSAALGLDGRVSPSNRITFGFIGQGSQGGGLRRNFIGRNIVQILAVCDVERNRRESGREDVEKYYARATSSGTYKGCSAYRDFRDLLDRNDIDVVVVATPDHWHAIPVIMSAKAGKDIYCEKPLSLTIAEGRAMSDAVHRYGRVFQTGSQQRSAQNFRFACELVRNGRIGEIQTIEVGLPRGPSCGPLPSMNIPDGFDYDLWLGPAPWAPYTDERCHWNFRWILDYSGGQLTDWGAHHLDIAQWGMGTELSGPVKISGSGKYPTDGLYNAATEYAFKCLYPSGVELAASTSIRGGITFKGSEGWIFVNRGQFQTSPRSLAHEGIRPEEVHLHESTDHYMDFLQAVQDRTEPVAPIEPAHRSVSIAHIANIAMQLERELAWNPDSERFVNDSEANKMLSRAMRSPWQI